MNRGTLTMELVSRIEPGHFGNIATTMGLFAPVQTGLQLSPETPSGIRRETFSLYFLSIMHTVGYSSSIFLEQVDSWPEKRCIALCIARTGQTKHLPYTNMYIHMCYSCKSCSNSISKNGWFFWMVQMSRFEIFNDSFSWEGCFFGLQLIPGLLSFPKSWSPLRVISHSAGWNIYDNANRLAIFWPDWPVYLRPLAHYCTYRDQSHVSWARAIAFVRMSHFQRFFLFDFDVYLKNLR